VSLAAQFCFGVKGVGAVEVDVVVLGGWSRSNLIEQPDNSADRVGCHVLCRHDLGSLSEQGLGEQSSNGACHRGRSRVLRTQVEAHAERVDSGRNHRLVLSRARNDNGNTISDSQLSRPVPSVCDQCVDFGEKLVERYVIDQSSVVGNSQLTRPRVTAEGSDDQYVLVGQAVEGGLDQLVQVAVGHRALADHNDASLIKLGPPYWRCPSSRWLGGQWTHQVQPRRRVDPSKLEGRDSELSNSVRDLVHSAKHQRLSAY